MEFAIGALGGGMAGLVFLLALAFNFGKISSRLQDITWMRKELSDLRTSFADMSTRFGRVEGKLDIDPED